MTMLAFHGKQEIKDVGDNLLQQAADLARIHVAGAAAQREIDRPAWERVQDLVHQLIVMWHDDDDVTCKCREEIFDELKKIADAKVAA